MCGWGSLAYFFATGGCPASCNLVMQKKWPLGHCWGGHRKIQWTTDQNPAGWCCKLLILRNHFRNIRPISSVSGFYLLPCVYPPSRRDFEDPLARIQIILRSAEAQTQPTVQNLLFWEANKFQGLLVFCQCRWAAKWEVVNDIRDARFYFQ